MIRDPLDKTVDPYDVFDLHPDSTPQQVHGAWANFIRVKMKKLKMSLTDGQTMLKRLRNPKDRAGVDIFYYQSVEVLPQVIGAEKAKDVVVGDYIEFPKLTVDIFLNAYLSDMAKDMQDFKFSAPKLRDLEMEYKHEVQRMILPLDL